MEIDLIEKSTKMLQDIQSNVFVIFYKQIVIERVLD